MKQYLLVILLSAFTLIGLIARADDAPTVAAQATTPPPTCGVPVCDIPAQIAELRKLEAGPRYNFYKELFENTKDTRDNASLKNLLEFGKAAYTLSKAIDVDEWVFTMAAEITNRSVERLLTQPPVIADILTDYYQSFIGDSVGSSFGALSYWKNQILNGQVSSLEELAELIKFARSARDISIKLKHDEYVINTATDIIAIASNRTLRVNPFIEGVYQIKTACKNSKDQLCSHFTTVAVVITDDLNGIAVTFAANSVTTPGFSFTKAEFVDGQSIENTKDNFDNQNAGFKFTVNPDTLEITGSISSSRVLNDIQFTGKKSFGNDKAYGQKPGGTFPKSNELSGLYAGQLNLKNNPKFPVTMVIRQIDRNLVATMQGENLKVEFGSGYYIPSKGILTLISSTNGMLVKITLSVQITANGKLKYTGTGIGMTTATNYSVELLEQ
ncbi:MAG: hypothetical protein H7328_02045 [Bdellovibrio sp.]|nr:hypothetical protein [Bdellovibrio sp.]